MEAQYTLKTANSLLPLLRVIAREIVERRGGRRELFRLREDLEVAATSEGLVASLENLEARIFEHKSALRGAIGELTDLGLSILRINPLTLHIPGVTRQGPITFCWQVGESAVSHGHAVGEEEEPRRPLRVRAG